MFKRILWGLMLAAILEISYSNYQQVNIYNAPRKILTYPQHFNHVINPDPVGSELPDFKQIFFEPTVKKVHEKHLHTEDLKIVIHYKMYSNFHEPVYRHVVDISKNLKVVADGAVWRASSHPQIVITPKNRLERGEAIFKLPIRSGYSESGLRHFRVYFIEHPNGTDTAILLEPLS